MPELAEGIEEFNSLDDAIGAMEDGHRAISAARLRQVELLRSPKVF